MIHCLGDLVLPPSGSSGAGSRPTTVSPAACGTTEGFLGAIGEARLTTPLRSAGGHRRSSRCQLRIAGRARERVTGREEVGRGEAGPVLVRDDRPGEYDFPRP
ncbi:hypothetical protein ACF07B_08970 [Streptomyces sp. NPDC015532]|uniref:hypothetical protein n=1 Tax=Streptomyces sp. NPDC015532 TaxID=3364960 RepID=UPI003700BE96